MSVPPPPPPPSPPSPSGQESPGLCLKENSAPPEGRELSPLHPAPHVTLDGHAGLVEPLGAKPLKECQLAGSEEQLCFAKLILSRVLHHVRV